MHVFIIRSIHRYVYQNVTGQHSARQSEIIQSIFQRKQQTMCQRVYRQCDRKYSEVTSDNTLIGYLLGVIFSIITLASIRLLRVI